MGYNFKRLKHQVRTIFKSWFISWFSSRHWIFDKSFLKAPFYYLMVVLAWVYCLQIYKSSPWFCLFVFIFAGEWRIKTIVQKAKKMKGDEWPFCKLESIVSILLTFLRLQSSNLNPEKEAGSGPWSMSLLAHSLWHFPVLSFYCCWRASRLDLVLTTDHHSMIRLFTKTKQWT